MPKIIIMVEIHKIKKERYMTHSYYQKISILKVEYSRITMGAARIDVEIEDEGSLLPAEWLIRAKNEDHLERGSGGSVKKPSKN